MANSEPMSEARLAEIRARAYTMYPLSSYPLEPNLVEWMGVASDDRCSLLAEVERLRAENGDLREIAACLPVMFRAFQERHSERSGGDGG